MNFYLVPNMTQKRAKQSARSKTEEGMREERRKKEKEWARVWSWSRVAESPAHKFRLENVPYTEYTSAQFQIHLFVDRSDNAVASKERHAGRKLMIRP